MFFSLLNLIRNFFLFKRPQIRRKPRRLFVESLEQRIVLDGQGLAVAFIDVDGDDQFTTNDKLIAEVIDTDNSGTWNTGDEVRYGALPTGTQNSTASTAPTANSPATSASGGVLNLPQETRAEGVALNGISFRVFFDSSGNKIGERFLWPNSNMEDFWDGSTADVVVHNPAAGPATVFGDIPGFVNVDTSAAAYNSDGDFFDIIIGGHVPGGATLNVAPVINDQSFTLDENSANGTVVGTAAASDADLPGDTLTWPNFPSSEANRFFSSDFSTQVVWRTLLTVVRIANRCVVTTFCVDLSVLLSTLCCKMYHPREPTIVFRM